MARECLEETGYEVKATALVSIIDRDRAGYPRHANTIYKMFFLCEIIGGQPTPNLESSQIEFFDMASLPELDPHRAARQDIERAHAFNRQAEDLPISTRERELAWSACFLNPPLAPGLNA